MDERRRNVAVGLTSLIGVAGLGGLLILFGYVLPWLETGYDVRIDMPNARGLTDKLTASVDRLSNSLSDGVSALRSRYVALADDLAGAVGSLRAFADSARTGTVGKLVKDPALYDNLNDATERLQKALDDLRLLVQKWKAEGLPVRF